MLGLFYEVQAMDEGCLWIQARVKGTTYLSDNIGTIQDSCNEIELAEVSTPSVRDLMAAA